MILQDVQYPKQLKPLKNYFTVVIFSPSLDHTCIPQYSKLLVQNIYWPSSTIKSSKNGSKIVDTIYNTYSKLRTTKCTKYLRIVCICVAKGYLPKELAKDILQYLKSSVNKSENKSPVDVIILPKFSDTGKDALDIMESLWYLREHAVLISSSSLHATLPSTEIIAVRGARLIPKTQDSVQDFVVTYSKKESATVTEKQETGTGDKMDPEKNDKMDPEKSDKMDPEKSDKMDPEKSDKMDPEKSDKMDPDKSATSDKIIQDSEWADKEQVQSTAQAVVCGITLNILDCLQMSPSSNTGGI